jgi:hypothetical protein
VRRSPISPSNIVEPEAPQERLQPQLRILQRDARGIAGATEIADRLAREPVCLGGLGSSLSSIKSIARFSRGSIKRAQQIGKQPCTIRAVGTRAFKAAWT